MTNQYHIIAIDNDYAYINSVILYSSHNTRKKAEEALEVIKQACTQSFTNKNNREKENYQRYLKWASKAIVECPNQYGGFNWIKNPGDPHHLANVKAVHYYTVKQFEGKTIVSDKLIQIRSSEPLILLEELEVPPEHYLEYYLVEPKKT